MVENNQQIDSRRWNLSARISTAFRSLTCHQQQRRNDRTARELLRQQRRAAAIAAAAATEESAPTRRRLPRGWWPDQGKREGLKLKAMNDLKDETFVSVLIVELLLVMAVH